MWRAVESDADSGGQVLAWTALGACWVNAVPVGGSEALSAGILRANENWRITLRHRDLLVTDRIEMDGRALEVVSVTDPDGRREVMVVMATLMTGAVDE
jgi:SPP1 family predicted phage head-tail adaptor